MCLTLLLGGYSSSAVLIKKMPRFLMMSPRSALSDGLISGVRNLLHLLRGPANNEI
jgi:hypothetical protein